MSKTFRAVKDFEFPSEFGFSGSAGQQMVKGYARGGSCHSAKGGNVKQVHAAKVSDKKTMGKNLVSREQSMARLDKSESPAFNSVPLIPSPAMKKGGSFGPKGQAKMGKVMGEFKSGELHSGSKKGPEVTSRKQAIAIAMSEARKAGKKK